MKYQYRGIHPTVCLVEGRLIQINCGDVVNVTFPPSSEFVAVKNKKASPPQAAKPKAKAHTVTKGIKNANRTETSGLG